MEDSRLSSAIIKFILGTMFLGMASLLPSMMEDMSKNANGTPRDSESMIKNLANELNQNEIVHKNPEWIFLVEKSKSEYVEKVYKNYMSLPKNKKLKNLTETKNQLTIILNGLVKVEDNLEKEVQKMQKANETFLNEKVKSIGEY